MTEIKPCPAGHPKYHYGIGGYLGGASGKYQVSCTCGWKGPESDTRELAVITWNARLVEDALRAENDRLKELLVLAGHNDL